MNITRASIAFSALIIAGALAFILTAHPQQSAAQPAAGAPAPTPTPTPSGPTWHTVLAVPNGNTMMAYQFIQLHGTHWRVQFSCTPLPPQTLTMFGKTVEVTSTGSASASLGAVGGFHSGTFGGPCPSSKTYDLDNETPGQLELAAYLRKCRLYNGYLVRTHSCAAPLSTSSAPTITPGTSFSFSTPSRATPCSSTSRSPTS